MNSKKILEIFSKIYQQRRHSSTTINFFLENGTFWDFLSLFSSLPFSCQGTLSKPEWEMASLYSAFAFRKKAAAVDADNAHNSGGHRNELSGGQRDDDHDDAARNYGGSDTEKSRHGRESKRPRREWSTALGRGNWRMTAARDVTDTRLCGRHASLLSTEKSSCFFLKKKSPIPPPPFENKPFFHFSWSTLIIQVD